MAYTNIHPIKVTLGKSINYICKFEKTGNGKYISSFLGFAKADNPAIIGIVLIDEPHGTYYGGTIAAPVMRSVFQTALPYMGIYKEYTPDKKEP
mgnify:CR=1 FL=1